MHRTMSGQEHPDVAALTYLSPENRHEFGTHRTRYRRTPG